MAEKETIINEDPNKEAEKKPESSELEKEITRLKAALSKSNAEAADNKRKLQERMTEQEKADAARAEADKALQDELTALRRDKTVSGYKAKYLELGYSAEQAEKMANSLADGNVDTLFETQKAFLDERTKTIQAQALNSQPGLTPGSAPGKESKEAAEDAALRSAFGL